MEKGYDEEMKQEMELEDKLRRIDVKERDFRDAEKDGIDERELILTDEFQLGQLLLQLSKHAQVSKQREVVAIESANGNITGWKMEVSDTGYLELCIPDVVSSFLTKSDHSYLQVCSSVCLQIKELAESMRQPLRDEQGKIIGWKNLDLTHVYNLVAGEYIITAITSKGLEGQAPLASRSHIHIASTSKMLTRSEAQSAPQQAQFPFRIKRQPQA